MRTIEKQIEFFMHLKFNDDAILTLFKTKESCGYLCCESIFQLTVPSTEQRYYKLEIVTYLSGNMVYSPKPNGHGLGWVLAGERGFKGLIRKIFLEHFRIKINI